MHQQNQANSMLRYLAIGVVALILGLFIGKHLGNHKTSSEENAETETQQTDANVEKKREPVLAVEVVAPVVGEVKVNIEADGTVSAKDTANVSAKVNGVAIEQIFVNEGDWVKQGQILAKFDANNLQQSLTQGRANVAQAQASVEKAKVDLARVRPLLEIDAVSRQEVDAYITAVKQAEAKLVATQAQMNQQQLAVNNANVIAPVTGVISKKNAQIGNVPQGSLFSIIQNGVLEWKVELNPEQLQNIQKGTPVAVQVTKDEWISGKVTRVAPVAGESRKITVYALLEGSRNIQAGMLLKGEFIIGSKPQIIVPVTSTVNNDGYDYLMMVTNIKKQDDKVVGEIKRIKVELGEQYGENVAVDSQIPNNAALVYQGGAFLNEGDLVTVVEVPNANNQQANQDNNPSEAADIPVMLQKPADTDKDAEDEE